MELQLRYTTLLMALTCAMVVITLPQVSAKRYIVGGSFGWASSGVNFTVWAQDKHFYLGDWLFFVYDRHQNNVLEVNKTNYENCIADHPRANWTTGAGRDVVPLNQTRHYYFISGNGFCYGGMKLAINVVKPPPPPSASPVKNAASNTSLRGNFVLPLVFAIGAFWDSFLRVMG
ncbi:early nodulin-like protein 17 [Silene latifolia]|uniref:early nodulin-like protein 17 n=1 Tax=Silene latifolia TaxID=37657 RepID=UPI003D78306A